MDFKFTDSKTKKISFPLGGIGSGCIGLSGNGRLIDWEIFNRPNKESFNEYTNFAVKAECGNEVLDARVLSADIQEGFMGTEPGSHHSWGIGQGPNRTTLAGMPHFKNTEFIGKFPMATVKFKDEKFPGNIELNAFNPFIPMNDKDSSIPAAFLEWSVHNPSDKEIAYTFSFGLGNPFKEKMVNKFSKEGNISKINLSSEAHEADSPKFGNLTVATDCDSISYQEYWYRSGWFDNLSVYWREFIKYGEYKNRSYDTPGDGNASGADSCTLAAKVVLKPHEKKTVRFLLSWYVPTVENFWNKPKEGEKSTWKNYYASLFNSSDDVANYCMSNWDRLKNDTELFQNALFSTNMPKEALDAIQGTISVLKSPTCLRLEDGELWAFEGVNKSSGSCEGSCTHVWNYTYAMPFLFPNLERSMREIEYKYNSAESGRMEFRTMLPLGIGKWGFRPCVDGQMGGILKVYREWKICGDDNWLKSLWPKVKKAIEYAWSPENEDIWDPEKTGVITGRQHNTLDIELFGANAWLTGFYLAALKAGSVMALHLGDKETAKEYMEIFERGQKHLNEKLFNGRYYIQEIDLKDKALLEKCCGKDINAINDYWNTEAEEIKYQIKDGCIIDQALAQWHANLLDLGEIFDTEKTRKAMETLYDLNFKSMRDAYNPCRIFAVNDEKGLVICEWPKDKEKQMIPIPYSEEVMTGFEYAAAGLMMQVGLMDEAINVIAGVRDRYDGEKRNPWNEMECGSNYARAMSSYSFLLTLSGFKFDMTEKMIGFNPIKVESFYRTFWSIEGAWGTFEIVNGNLTLNILYGELELNKFIVPDACKNIKKIFTKVSDLGFKLEDNKVCFSETVKIKRNESVYFLI